MPAILRKFLPNLVASLIIIGPYAQIGAIVTMVGVGEGHGGLEHYTVMTIGCHCSIGGDCSLTGWAVSHIHITNKAITIRRYLT